MTDWESLKGIRHADIPHGTAEYIVGIDWARVRAMVQKATNSKAKLAKAGPVTVRAIITTTEGPK
jgi:hypothetical protein